MTHEALARRAIDKAKADVARYGYTIQSMVFAQYTDENGKQDIRAFQWKRYESRSEAIRLISWAASNGRTVTLTPAGRFIAINKLFETNKL